MEQFIYELGIMSLQAAVVVCVVLVVRWVFSGLHVPKKYMNILWILPFIVMIFPWRIESSFSFWREPSSYQMERARQVVERVQDMLAGTEDGVQGDDMSLPGYISDELADGNNMNALGTVAGIAQTLKDGAGDSLDITGTGPDGTESMIITTTNRGNISIQDGKGENLSAGADNSLSESVQWPVRITFILWILGISGLLIYSVVSYVQLHRKVLCSIHVSDNVYRGDDVDTPFVLGVLRPRIYIPNGIPAENLPYVLEHEKTHIRKCDPLKKMLAFIIAGIHWFNPFAWIAFYFFGRDMEMACDEETVTRLGMEKKKDYAEALLQLASGKRIFLAAPLAFGEGDVKSRIQNIVNYKKTLTVVSVAAVAVIALLAVGFLSQNTTITVLSRIDDNFIGFSENAEEREIHLTIDGETTDFPVAYFDAFMEFFQGLEVEKNPISRSRAEDRAMDVKIEVGEGSFIYLNEDYGEIWMNNGVKPSFSYRIEDPQAVIDFLNTQVGSIAEAVPADGERNEPTDPESENEVLPSESEGQKGVEEEQAGDKTQEALTLTERYPALLEEKLVFAMDRLFVYTGIDVSKAVFEDMIQSDMDTPVMGKLASTVEPGMGPAEEMQSNFGYVDSEVVFYSSGMAVNMDDKWIYFADGNLLDVYDIEDYQLFYIRRHFSDEFDQLVIKDKETKEALASYPERAGLDTEKYRLNKIENLMGYTAFCFYDVSTWWFPYGYYYTVENGALKLLGESWGNDESETYIVDVNDDGVTELICNNLYGDGVREAVIYYNLDFQIQKGSCSDLLDEAYDNVNVAALNSNYLPEENLVNIDFYKADIDGMKSKQYEIDLDKIDFWMLEPVIVGSAALEDYTLALRMYYGRYSNISEPGPESGPGWSGYYELVLVENGTGTVKSNYRLKEWDETFRFGEDFELNVTDYNEDGIYEVLLGQYVSQNFNEYRMYYIDQRLEIGCFSDLGKLAISNQNLSPKLEVEEGKIVYSLYDNTTGNTTKKEIRFEQLIP